MKNVRLEPFRPKIPPPGWKCPKSFKLGLGSPQESSDSEEDSKNEINELLLIASQQYESEEDSKNEINELLVMHHNSMKNMKEVRKAFQKYQKQGWTRQPEWRKNCYAKRQVWTRK